MADIYKICKYLVLMSLVAGFMHGCTIINPKETVPTYIHIDSFHYDDVGSHEIKAVEVYYNNNPVGYFDLPVTFPIIATQTGTLLVSPAVSTNGQNDRMVTYPFYSQDTFTFAPQPGAIINYTPKTKYTKAAKFFILSDFDYGLIKLSRARGQQAITSVSDPALVYQGNGTGLISLNAVGDSSVDSSNTAFGVTLGAAFIEFDYKTEVPFAVGMQANLGSLYVIDPYYLAGIAPSMGQWRKFYMNITGYLSQYPASSYYFYIKAYTVDAPGKMYIDNIKLVTY